MARTSVGSSSFSSGVFAASVVEVEVLTPGGHRLMTQASGPEAEEFAAATTGPTDSFVLAARVRLCEAGDYVATRQIAAANSSELGRMLGEIAQDRSFEGDPVDFIEAVSRGSGQHVISLGRLVSAAQASCHAVNPSRFDGHGPSYAESLIPGSRDLLTMADYLTRWESDGFWRSSYYGLANRALRRLLPSTWRTPVFYDRIDALLDGRGPARGVEQIARWQPGAARVFRELAIPLGKAGDLVDSLARMVPQVPIWLTPYRPQDADTGDDYLLYAGIWGPGSHQRRGHALSAESAIDRLASDLGGTTVRSGA
jgi:hypothetical protein